MSINIDGSQTSQQPTQKKVDLKQQELQDEAQKADQKLKEYYNSLGMYSTPSMNNICDLYNAGYESEGKAFHKEHISYCDFYGNAALAFGDVILNIAEKTINDIKNAINNVKTATDKAINCLKGLIKREDSTIESKLKPNEGNASIKEDENTLYKDEQTAPAQHNNDLNRATKSDVNNILKKVNINLSELPEKIQEDIVNKYTNMLNFASSHNLKYYDTDRLNENLISYAQAKIDDGN